MLVEIDKNSEMVDSYSFGLTTIDTVHRRVHSGCYFGCDYHASIADTATMIILFKNASKEFHFLYEIECVGSVDINVYRKPTITSNGISLTLHCFNDEMKGTSESTIFHTPIISNNGELWFNRFSLGINAPVVKSLSSIRPGVEKIMDRNTNYLFRITNSSGGTSIINFWIEGYLT